MTTKEQDATEQQRGRGDSTVAGQARPILGDSQTVCRVMVENLFGKRHWAAGWALDLCSADPQFLTHLAEQPRGYAHFLCLIRMALLARGSNSGSAQDEARMLRAGSKEALLDELLPSSPVEIISLLPKFPKKPLHEEIYRELLRVLEDKMLRKHLLHKKRISESTVYSILLIERFPAQYRSAAIHLINGHNFQSDYLVFLAITKMVEKFNLKVTERELVRAAKKTKYARELRIWIYRKISKLPFPPPPWEGSDKIRPVRSRDELKEMAAKIENGYSHHRTLDHRTLDNHASHIVAGDEYVYVCEHIPAMIQIRRDRDVYTKWAVCGWSIGEISGKKYKPVSLYDRYELARAFIKFQHADILPEVSW